MTSPKMYLTVGISASGKTTFTEELCKHEDFVNVNNDDLRKSLFSIKHWDEYDFDKNEKIITFMRHNLVTHLLKEKRNIIL